MEKVKKISSQGQIKLNKDELAHIGCEEGGYIILKDDGGRHGNFISLFAPSERHKGLPRYGSNNGEDAEGVKEELLEAGV